MAEHGQRQTCCGHVHPFDARRVRSLWWPDSLRCLIVGENPGSAESAYFYDPIPIGNDPVGVRRLLLPALRQAELIPEASLAGFKSSGFVFDHAIRCPLPSEAVRKERARARRLRPSIADNASHLRAVVESAPTVWIMGGVARAAVKSQFNLDFLAKPLSPAYVDGKFLISQYLRPRFDDAEAVEAIVGRLKTFLTDQGSES